MADLNEHVRGLLSEPNLASIATIMYDGSPQVTPVWIDVEGNEIWFNTAIGRLKEMNLRRDPRVAISVVNRENPWDKAEIRGRVIGFVEGQEALDHIDKMAKKYIDQDKYPFLQPGERRVIIRTEPLKIAEMPEEQA